MKELTEFMKERNVNVLKVENDLGLTRGTIKVSTGYIPKKHINVIREYLEEHYHYGEVTSEDKVEVVQRWNVGRPYDFADGEARYQDDEGLWRRVSEKGDMTVDVIGKSVNKWFPATGEVEEDWKGMFLVLRNGVKAYVGMGEHIAASKARGTYDWNRVDYKKKFDDIKKRENG